MAPTGPVGPVWRSPLIEVDRKWSARRQTGAFDPRQTSSHRTYPFAKRKAVSCAAFSGPFGNRVDRLVGNPIVTQTPRSTTCASFILSPLFLATAFGQS